MANAERLDRLLVTLAEKMPSDGTTGTTPQEEEQLEHERRGSSGIINGKELLEVPVHHHSGDVSGHLVDNSPAVKPWTTTTPATPSCQECMPYCRQV